MAISLEKSKAGIIRDREHLTEQLMGFARADCLLYWSPSEKVFAEQEKLWFPILTWVGNILKIELKTTTGLDEPTENRQYGPAFRKIILELDDVQFAAFYVAASLMRSDILALALVKGRLSADDAFEAAFVEEIWQAKIWGIDEEAEKRRQAIHSELKEIEKFLQVNGKK